MNKEFVPYEQALALKELGFDEPCFGCVLNKRSDSLKLNGTKSMFIPEKRPKQDIGLCLVPTFSQAFRWFREKYELHSYIYSDYSWNISGGIWDLNGYKDLRYDWDSEPYTTFEEAESACIEKLIEIVKNYNETYGGNENE